MRTCERVLSVPMRSGLWLRVRRRAAVGKCGSSLGLEPTPSGSLERRRSDTASPLDRAQLPEPSGGLEQNIVGLAEDEADLAASVGGVVVEAGARHGCYANLAREPHGELGVGQVAQLGEVGQDVVSAFGRNAAKPSLDQ